MAMEKRLDPLTTAEHGDNVTQSPPPEPRSSPAERGPHSPYPHVQQVTHFQ